jgi:uncharacterized protein (DUF2132 family)
MRFSIEDLTEVGRARLEDDFQRSARRGKRGSLGDFAEGWMALAYRHKLWSYFTPEARARLDTAA